MSLVFATTFFFGGDTLSHGLLAVQTDFEFEISGPLLVALTTGLIKAAEVWREIILLLQSQQFDAARALSELCKDPRYIVRVRIYYFLFFYTLSH